MEHFWLCHGLEKEKQNCTQNNVSMEKNINLSWQRLWGLYWKFVYHSHYMPLEGRAHIYCLSYEIKQIKFYKSAILNSSFLYDTLSPGILTVQPITQHYTNWAITALWMEYNWVKFRYPTSFLKLTLFIWLNEWEPNFILEFKQCDSPG
jgi:hypothetical protein